MSLGACFLSVNCPEIGCPYLKMYCFYGKINQGYVMNKLIHELLGTPSLAVCCPSDKGNQVRIQFFAGNFGCFGKDTGMVGH